MRDELDPAAPDPAALAVLFDRSVVGVAVIGSDDRLLAINTKFAEVLGYVPRELVGRTWMDVTLMADRDIDKANIQEVRSGKRNSYAFFKRFTHKDGRAVPLNVQVDAVGNGDNRLLLKQSYAPAVQAAGDPLAAEKLRAEMRRSMWHMGVGVATGFAFAALGTYANNPTVTTVGAFIALAVLGGVQLVDKWRSLKGIP